MSQIDLPVTGGSSNAITGPGSATPSGVATFTDRAAKTLTSPSSVTIDNTNNVLQAQKLIIGVNNNAATFGNYGVSIGDSNGAPGPRSLAGGYGTECPASDSIAWGYLAKSGVSSADQFCYSFGAKANAGVPGAVVFADSLQQIYTTSRKSDSMRFKYNNGYEFLKSDFPGNAPVFGIRQESTTTSDATANVYQTWLDSNNIVQLVSIRITARRTGGTAGATNDGGFWEYRSFFRNTGNTLTLLKSTLVDSYSDQAWTTAISVSGANIVTTLTGAANNNVRWDLHFLYHQT